MPVLHGVVLDLDGLPLDMSGGHLQLDETLGRDASASWHTLVPVGADGTFAVRVMPWGDASQPVRLTLSFGPSDYVAPIVTTSDGATCYRWTGLTGIIRLELALGDGSAAPYVVVPAARTAEEEICGAQGTPSPTPRRSSLASPRGPATPAASETPPATSTAAGDEPGSVAPFAIAILLLAGAGLLTIARPAGRRRR